MNEWKEAWKLSKTELKRWLWWIVLGAAFFIMTAVLLGFGFPYYMDNNPLLEENNPGLYDMIFVFMFCGIASCFRPKDFRYHMVDSGFWVTPYFVKLMQLPVPDRIIVKHRFLSHMVLSIPYYVMFLILFYITSGLTGEFMSPVTFLVFAVIWLSFSVYVGHIFPASDAGTRLSRFKLILLYVFVTAFILAAYIVITFYSPHGLVGWTVIFAEKWPLLSLVISIVLAFLGMRYWMYHMKKTMNKLDYLYG